MLVAVVTMCLVGMVVAMPAGTDMTDEGNMMKFLNQFGYGAGDNPMLAGLSDTEAFSQAIADYQAFSGIPVTGIADAATSEMMGHDRCGNKDVLGMRTVARRRRKRYVTQGSMWSQTDISFRITKYSPDMSRQDIQTEIGRALAVWESVSPIRFINMTGRSGPVDIEISFEPRSHGDGFDFDGRGRTLAHAFYPRWGGNAHMDEAETWSANTTRGVNLFQVAAHELGHSLGLAHSSVRAALMAPVYRGFNPNFQLNADDIAGIQKIYGPKPDMMGTTTTTTTTRAPAATTTTTTTTTMAPPPPDMPKPCEDGVLDAIIVTSSTRTTYAFRNDYYMVLTRQGVAPGYPRPISADWPRLSGSVDAAITFPAQYRYSRTNGRWYRDTIVEERIFVFKGDNVYLYDTKRELAPGFPKRISAAFPGLPSNIDAAFVWSGNSKTYFIKGNQYYRYSHGAIQYRNKVYTELAGSVDMNYPRPLSIWTGVPAHVDSVTVWTNGKTYFFAGNQYYRFNDRSFSVESNGHYTYPASTRENWLGCSGNVDMMDMEEMEVEGDAMDVVTTAPIESDPQPSGQSSLTAAFVTVLTSVIISRL